MLRQGARPALAHTQILSRQCRRSNSSGLWSTTSSIPPSEPPTTSRASEHNSDKRKQRRVQARERVRSNLLKIAAEVSRKEKGEERAPRIWKERAKQPAEQTEKRLRDIIQTKSQNLESAEKETFFRNQAELASESVLVSDPNSGLEDVEILPGSFIATRRNDITTLGIVLGFQYPAGREAIVMFTPTGEIWYPFRDDVTFVLPAFISSNMAARCGTLDAPSNDSELSARMEALKRLRELVHKLESKSAERVLGPDIWDKFKAKDSDAWGEVTVGDVAQMISKNPQFDTIFAAHLFLMNDSLHFVAKHPYLVTQAFDVRPRNEVDLLRKVLTWKRTGDSRLEKFVQKAKPIIAANSRRVKESALSPPTVEIFKEVKWTEDDKSIIRFLQLSLRPTRSNQADPYVISRSAIMRMLDPTHPLFIEADVARLLVNLGVFSPWQDILAIQPPNTEPEYDPVSPRVKRQEAIATRSLSRRPPAGAPLGIEDFYPSDPLEPVRHDFGDLPVFVIDAADAQELDDGVSIEPILSEPGTYWIHAHIANPTATLPPSHILAMDAMRQGESLYFQHHSVPLFPPSLMYNPKLAWSLSSQKGKPSKVITFSAKINSNGELVDRQVRAGLINHVRVLSYDEVNKILGYDPVASGDIVRPFGGLTPPVVDAPQLPKKELDDLRALYKVTRAIQANWCKTYVVRPAPTHSSATYGEFPPGSMTPSTTSRIFKGFPDFKDFTVSSPALADRGSMGVVQEVMKVAGRVGSMFALEHNLPMVRRAMPSPFLDSEATEKLKSVRTESGVVSLWQAISSLVGVNPPRYTLSPDEHFHVGALAGQGYTRVTSPLRRALDLVGHWQLHRALLGKHADSQKPMFDVDWMDKFRVSFGVMEGQHKKISRNHTNFWVAQFVKKWMNGELRGDGFVPYDPHRIYEGHLISKGWLMFEKSGKAYGVDVPELGVVGTFETPLSTDFEIGDKVPMKLSSVDLKLKSDIRFCMAGTKIC